MLSLGDAVGVTSVADEPRNMEEYFFALLAEAEISIDFIKMKLVIFGHFTRFIAS